MVDRGQIEKLRTGLKKTLKLEESNQSFQGYDCKN